MKMAKTTALLLIILLCLPNTIALFHHTHDESGPHGSCSACINAINHNFQRLLYAVISTFCFTQPTTPQSPPIFTPFTQYPNTLITLAVRLNN